MTHYYLKLNCVGVEFDFKQPNLDQCLTYLLDPFILHQNYLLAILDLLNKVLK